MTGAVRVAPAWDDPAAVLALIREAGPFPALARYAASDAEKRATGSAGGTFVPPWFRFDIATGGEVHLAGGDSLLHNPRFIEAAHEVFGAGAVIEPTTVYVNVMGPCGYPFVAHTDVPVFRGRSRDTTPVWLLHLMHTSGLFAEERISMATAVSWFFGGPGGDFYYWPDGPAGEPRVERAPFGNVAVVADNELTFHGVAPVGLEGAPSPAELSLDAEIAHCPEGWVVTDGGHEVMVYDDASVRITTSWKCEVFDNAAERDLVRSGDVDLGLAEVIRRFSDNLGLAPPVDPLTDPAWIDALSTAYPRPKLHIPRGQPR